jgi:DNA-binding transcriptional MerR regulator
MLRISEFARAANVTIRTLRFYDHVGLLRPAHVSPESGYRGYNPAQFAELSRIQTFKDMGFALGEILQLLRNPLPANELRRVLLERREVLRGRVREDVGRLARIEARLGSLEEPGNSAPLVLFGETREQWVASVREKLASYEETDALFAELERKIDPALLGEGRATIWHSCIESEGKIDCEAVCFLKRRAPARQGLKSYTLAPVSIAFAYHYGSEESIGKTYQSIAHGIAERGYRLAGAKREVYWPTSSARGESGSLTEVQFPIGRSRAGPRAELRTVRMSSA